MKIWVRKLIAWGCLLCYFWSSSPVLGYQILYQIQKSDIVRELCREGEVQETNCNGKCFLSQKAKEAESPDAEAQVTLVKFPEHMVENNSPFSLHWGSSSLVLEGKTNLSTPSFEPLVPPPKNFV